MLLDDVFEKRTVNLFEQVSFTRVGVLVPLAPSIVDEGMPRKRLRASAELRISVVRITSRLGLGSADSARS